MITLLIQWILLALGLLFVAWILPGVSLDGFLPALWATLIMGLINISIKPVLILLTIPINILTLGLFTFIINALLFWFVSSVVDGFEVNGFLAALFGSLLFTIISTFINNFDVIG